MIVAVGCLSMVLVFSVHYAFGVFFKPLLDDFGWTRAMISGAFSLVWVSQGLVGIPMGALNDKLGSRIVLTVCGLTIGIGYLLMSQIHAIWQLYLFYGVIVGAGLSGTFVPLTSTAARWFTEKRGLMTGIVTAGVGIGALIGPLAANHLITIYRWRTAYLILGSIALVGVTLMAQLMKRPPESGPVDQNLKLRTEQRSHPDSWSLKQAASGLPFWLAVAVFFCYGFTLSAILLHLPPHATDLGFSATEAASLVAVLGGASVFAKVLLGVAADKIGNKQVYILSFILMLGSLLWLLSASQLWMLYLFAAVFGIAYGGLATAHAPLIAWLFGIRNHGLIFGACFNGWTLGCAVGPIIAGYIYDMSHSYQAAFITCLAMTTIGLTLTFFLKPQSSAHVIETAAFTRTAN